MFTRTTVSPQVFSEIGGVRPIVISFAMRNALFVNISIHLVSAYTGALQWFKVLIVVYAAMGLSMKTKQET